MKAQKINQVAEAIKAAAQAAREADGFAKCDPQTAQANMLTIDGGTCNFDTLVINFSGWQQTDINEVESLSGIRIGEKLSGFHKGCRFVWVPLNGQAANRTRMAEAANRKLKELGMDSSVWYQMD